MRPHVVRIATTGKGVTIEIMGHVTRGNTGQDVTTGTTGQDLTMTTNKVEDKRAELTVLAGGVNSGQWRVGNMGL